MNRAIPILAGFVVFLALLATPFLFWEGAWSPYVVTLAPEHMVGETASTTDIGSLTPGDLIHLNEAPLAVPNPFTKEFDIENQAPLEHPPEVVKAIYATSWSAGSTKKMDALIQLIRETELNAIVIDIKDFSGYVTYGTSLPVVHEYDAYELRTPKLNALLKRLHDNGIYTIARIAVFQDTRLALAQPNLALMSSSTQGIWKDHKGLMWVDPAGTEAWDYNIAIARDAFERGFDEVNFDYIRFASDGALNDIVYPFWDGKTAKAKVIRDFWHYTRKALPGKKLSADLFGLAAVSYDDLGIGQKIEYSFGAFDAVAPMVYPSHYYPGSLGFQKPAEHPYEIVFNSMREAVKRLKIHNAKQAEIMASSTLAAAAGNEHFVPSTLRPWIQDFDLGADYDAAKVRAQIQAAYDAASGTPELISGWMLWNPSNVYTKEALEAATSQ